MFDCKLWALARGHSEDMAENDYFSHTSRKWDGGSESMSERAAVYGTTTHGENIAKGYNDPQRILDNLLNSYGHCLNIMKPDYKYFAVGFAYSKNTKFFFKWTQNFRYNDGGHSAEEREECYAGKFE